MKILLQDEKTGIENVKRVEEHFTQKEMVLHIYVGVGKVTAREIMDKVTKTGIEKITVLSEEGKVDCVYENYRKIKNIVTSYSDADRYTRLTLIQD